jgi:glutamyl-tRNA synthetase
MSASPLRVRVRAAPSPTGPPHVGNAYIALFDYVFARQQGGDFILRIEDTDRSRSSAESEKALMEAFRWLGLCWDEGPDVGGPCGPYRQSGRAEIYREYAQLLLDAGAVYRCFCSPERLARMRQQQRAKGTSGYDRLCRNLTPDETRANLDAGVPYVLRLKTPQTGETSFTDAVRGVITVSNAEIDDQVLLKSDGFPTYHLANVVDDHLMQVSHVVRAEEWISSTPKHVLLYEALGWEPPEFIHMPLLRGADRSKISKRKNPTSLTWYREQGFLPEAMLNFLALMGWSFGDDREVFGLDEMVANFSWERVRTSGPVFDLQKLEWLNGQYIRSMTAEELLQRILAGPYTVRVDEPIDRLLRIAALARDRMRLLSEFDSLTGFFFAREDYGAEDLVPKGQGASFVREALPEAAACLGRVEPWEAEPLEASMQELAEARGWKRGALYMLLRVAVTCRKVSTPLFETMAVLGKAECTGRLAAAASKAQELPAA